MKVLVIDDEGIILKAVSRVLNRSGHEVEGLPDGRLAIEKIKDFTPDIIFLDMKMPGCSGLELLDKIKLYDSNIKVIMMSGYISSENKQEAIEKGADRFLEKPFDDISDITRALDELL